MVRDEPSSSVKVLCGAPEEFTQPVNASDTATKARKFRKIVMCAPNLFVGYQCVSIWSFKPPLVHDDFFVASDVCALTSD